MRKKYSDFQAIVPEIASNSKVSSTFNMMALWDFQSQLYQEKRFLELVWIHPNLTELNINSILKTQFFVKGGQLSGVHDELIESLNLQQKIRLLFSLGLVDQETFSRLESWRALRNSLVHKLMQKVRKGSDLDKECEHFCKLGMELQEQLHDLLMSMLREVAFPELAQSEKEPKK